MERQPCIVLAGGLGTRLRSVTGDLPKCLAPVQGQPFLWWLLQVLRQQGFGPVMLSLGHGADQVIAASAGWDVRHVVESEALGTGGAIRMALQEAGWAQALVVNGDTLVGGSLRALLSPLGYLPNGQPELLRMAAVAVEDRSRFGGLSISTDGRLTGFLEKGRSGPGAINAGIYRVHSDVFNRAPVPPAGQAFSFEAAVLPELCQQGVVGTVPIQGRFIDIGVPEDYRRLCEGRLLSELLLQEPA